MKSFKFADALTEAVMSMTWTGMLLRPQHKFMLEYKPSSSTLLIKDQTKTLDLGMQLKRCRQVTTEVAFLAFWKAFLTCLFLRRFFNLSYLLCCVYNNC